MKEVKCSVCNKSVAFGAEYNRYKTGHLLCEDCNTTHAPSNISDLYIRGTYDYWDGPVVGDEAASFIDEQFGYGAYDYLNETQTERSTPPVNVEAKKSEMPQGLLVCKGQPKINMNDIEVMFTQETFNQMFAYIDASSVEISGIGRIKRIIEGNKIGFVIHELFLLKQRNTGTSTHLDPQELSSFLVDRVRQNLPVGDIKFWWHSHVNMQAFWSGTDNSCCDGFEIEGNEKDNWFLSIVSNKRREMRCRLDIFKPYRVTIDELPVKVIMNFSDPDKEKWEKEVKEKCNESSWSGYFRGGHTGYKGRETEVDQKQIGFDFLNGHHEQLRYYKDMTEQGQLIETLHYKHGDDLYRLFNGNDKVPTHKVPNLKNMQKTRDWYIDKSGHMCNKNNIQIVKDKGLLSIEEKVLFYKLHPGCECVWCKEQLILIQMCESIKKEKDGNK